MASSNASRSSPISSHAEPAHARIERALQLPAERKEWCRSTQLRFCRAPPCGGQCGSPILAETTMAGPASRPGGRRSRKARCFPSTPPGTRKAFPGLLRATVRARAKVRTGRLGPEQNTADGRAVLGPELKPHGLAEPRIRATLPSASRQRPAAAAATVAARILLTHVNIHHRRTGMYYCRTSSDHEAWPLHSPGPSACGSAHAWKQKSRPERHTHVVDSSATSSPRRVHSVTTEPLRGPRIVLPWGSHPGATG